MSGCRKFIAGEAGSLTLFSLILFLIMFLVGGLAVDMLVYENNRARLQNLSDRASLAAADLDQRINYAEIIASYYEKEGMSDYLQDVTVDDIGVRRSVEITSGGSIPSMFMRMVGIDDMPVPAHSLAKEVAGNVEISLVLDNSGSMGNTDGDSTTRLEELKQAVATFLGVMYPEGADPTVTVSIVPYASQVNAGPALTSLLNVTQEHSYSDCVEFDESAFGSLSLDLTANYQRSAHFDMYSTSQQPTRFKCRPENEQHIYVMGSDPAVIQSRVDALTAQGWTSLDLGAKWGAALLDPSANSLVQSLVGNPEEGVLPQHIMRPVAYDNTTTVKALVLMTDGINTETQNLNPPYNDGNSDLWKGQGSIAEIFATVPGLSNLPSLTDLINAGVDVDVQRSWYALKFDEGANHDEDGDGAKNEQWWTPAVYFDGELVIPEQWAQSHLKGSGGSSGRMKWVDVWAEMTPDYYKDTFVYGPFNDSSAADAFDQAIYTPVMPSTKDSRLASLCNQARSQGLTVYTVGLNVSSHSRDVLRSCATTENYFLDANQDNLEAAFEQIAASILNLKLRLIQ